MTPTHAEPSPRWWLESFDPADPANYPDRPAPEDKADIADDDVDQAVDDGS